MIAINDALNSLLTDTENFLKNNFSGVGVKWLKVCTLTLDSGSLPFDSDPR